MKFGFGNKKRTPRGVPEDEPVNHLRRAILESITVPIWLVLIIGSLVNTGKVTETLVMSCIPAFAGQSPMIGVLSMFASLILTPVVSLLTKPMDQKHIEKMFGK